MTTQPLPKSTYRLQITASRDLHHAAALIPYLTNLGVDWAHLSPILESEPGSDHGYDVVDHGKTDAARGGRVGLAAFAAAAHQAGMGVLVDIVPNHVGIATPRLSLWWWDVLAKGAESEFAGAFDIDWKCGNGRVRLPMLGDGDHELAKLKVVGEELHYYGHHFPIAVGTSGGSAQDVHRRQHYELMNYRCADVDLNYRRFFGVSTLAGIRVELPAVFAASHTEIKAWFDNRWVDGLRVDHPDGLADPAGYLRDLQSLVGGSYVLVEKILAADERLPADWDCHGTTGYDALAALDRLFVDPSGESALNALDTELRGGTDVDWNRMTTSAKRDVAQGILLSETLRLARELPHIDGAAEAIAELLASFQVYRTYSPGGTADLDNAVAAALARKPLLAAAIAGVAAELRGGEGEFTTRFQQTSGMVMAKGVEDRAFYRWTRLTSLTEVGGEPAQFSVSASEFHRIQARRISSMPYTMTTLSTHDTKRGEDVRARISVISEIAQEWTVAVRHWNRLAPLIDGPLAHLLWQAIVGCWPSNRDRLHAYATKAAREAGVCTGWIDPDTRFEESVHALVDAVFDHPELASSVAAFVERVTAAGWSNSLSAKLLQLLGPGVPDVYQGTELWQNSLVDPDNRRPVDYRVAQAILQKIDDGWLPPVDASGAVKLLVVSRALRLRRDRSSLFTGYFPLTATGSAAEHLVAFDRGGAIAVATRLPLGLVERGGWQSTDVTLPPGRWRNVLAANFAPIRTGRTAVSQLLNTYPVALLVRED